MTSPNYGRDDYIACLAFAGPPPNWVATGSNTYTAEHSAYLARRVDQINLVEEFCEHWFAGKIIDGQYAGFYTNYCSWYKQEKANVETHRLARNHPMCDLSRT